MSIGIAKKIVSELPDLKYLEIPYHKVGRKKADLTEEEKKVIIESLAMKKKAIYIAKEVNICFPVYQRLKLQYKLDEEAKKIINERLKSRLDEVKSMID